MGKITVKATRDSKFADKEKERAHSHASPIPTHPENRQARQMNRQKNQFG
jgi:hypothetical protein